MGQFSVRATIAHPTDRTKSVEVDLLVDTGATLSWVPRELVERLGMPPAFGAGPLWSPTDARLSVRRPEPSCG